MSKCNNCNIEINFNSNCPFCGKHINESPRALHYPTYYLGKVFYIKKILSFIFLTAGIISLFLDFWVTKYQGWSLAACAGLFMLWFMAVKPIFDKKPFTVFVTQCVYFVCIWAAVLEVFGSKVYNVWPASYVIPAAVALGITAILFASFIKKVNFSEVGVYIITLSLINLLIIILGLVKVVPHVDLSIIVGVYSVICLFGMRYFLSKKFTEGIKKKMHI